MQTKSMDIHDETLLCGYNQGGPIVEISISFAYNSTPKRKRVLWKLPTFSSKVEGNLGDFSIVLRYKYVLFNLL